MPIGIIDHFKMINEGNVRFQFRVAPLNPVDCRAWWVDQVWRCSVLERSVISIRKSIKLKRPI